MPDIEETTEGATAPAVETPAVETPAVETPDYAAQFTGVGIDLATTSAEELAESREFHESAKGKLVMTQDELNAKNQEFLQSQFATREQQLDAYQKLHARYGARPTAVPRRWGVVRGSLEGRSRAPPRSHSDCRARAGGRGARPWPGPSGYLGFAVGGPARRR